MLEPGTCHRLLAFLELYAFMLQLLLHHQKGMALRCLLSLRGKPQGAGGQPNLDLLVRIENLMLGTEGGSLYCWHPPVRACRP